MGKFYRIRGGALKERPEEDFERVCSNPKSDWIVKEDAHPALVEDDLWNKIQVKMHGVSNTRKSKDGQKNCRCRNYLSSYYLQRGKSLCNYNKIDRDLLDDFVVEKIKEEFLKNTDENEVMKRLELKLANQPASRHHGIDRIKTELRRLDKQISEASRRILTVKDTSILPELRVVLNQ
jgi:SMC interacting uncharacterized protein involved in chromosome segregation